MLPLNKKIEWEKQALLSLVIKNLGAYAYMVQQCIERWEGKPAAGNGKGPDPSGDRRREEPERG